MPKYKVKWEIEVEADNPEDAARTAYNIQKDRNTNRTKFEVVSKTTGVVNHIDTQTDLG